MAIKTLYTVLGVDPTADDRDIDAAFVRHKLRYPAAVLAADDGARNQFAAIQQAHATLSNPDSRSLYDVKLKRVGIETVTTLPVDAEETASRASTRNILAAGIFALIAAGMWFYHVQEETRVKKELAVRALQLEEEQKRHRAELEQAEEDRRQARFDAQQRREQEMRDRQFQVEAQRDAQRVTADMQRHEQNAEAVRRREQATNQSQQENARRQIEADARRRADSEKQLLRQMCYERYRRADC